MSVLERETNKVEMLLLLASAWGFQRNDFQGKEGSLSNAIQLDTSLTGSLFYDEKQKLKVKTC